MSDQPAYPLRFVARATIEFETPFIIGTGGDDLFFDDVFVADANGLPALPGSSLAGILRHAWAEAGLDDGSDIFGCQNGDQGQGSRLSVSWGCIHDSHNRPVEGIVFDRQRLDDPVLAEARTLSARDHVRISHRGTAADKGKFDERSVSAGHRFTFELLLEGKESDTDSWNRLLSLLKSDAIRIGGKTRRGYGQFKVVSLRAARFNLGSRQDFDAYCALPVALAQPSTLPDVLGEIPGSASGAATATLSDLRPEAFWMIGGGFDPDVDMAPLKANRIVWDGDKAKVDRDRVIVPGTSVKGAISHRVAFHYNRLSKTFAGEGVNPEEHTGENNKAVRELFGFCKDSKNGRNEGQRGRVIISDLFVEKPGDQKILNHVSIDRFTGGARVLEGALFDEKPFHGGDGFTVKVIIADPDGISDANVRKALALALEDLASGRLGIGAGTGRGNGYFTNGGRGIHWDETGNAWLAGGVNCE